MFQCRASSQQKIRKSSRRHSSEQSWRRCWFHGQYFMTIHDTELTGFGMLVHAENTRDDGRSTQKRWFGGRTKCGQVLEVKSTYHLYQCGIEIQIDSMKNDGSQSWTVISSAMNEYVNELPEENEKSIHYEEVTASTGRPFATKQKEQFTASLS